MNSTITTTTSEREIIITRLLDAPRELVFEAWTNPKHIVNWFGPDGFTTTIKEWNLEPGGVWRFTMHGPDGRDYPNKIVFIEIVKPERLVYKHNDDGTEGLQFHVTVTFEMRGNQTFLTMRTLFDTKEELDYVVKEHGAIEGGHQHANRLAQYLLKMEELSS